MNTASLSLSEEELKERFYKLNTREDVALLLQISDYQLRYHLYIYPLNRAYTTFEIKKKAGGSRSISAPKTSLKIIQRKLNQVFRSVYKSKPSTHGFAVQKSIITNARQHLRKRYVLNLDLKNFFPSINFGRVRGLLMAPPYNCTEEVATVLAQICCYDNQLPQGAPTSPIISNMICAKLDSQLQRLASKYQCTYTRYADDITFSTTRPRFPPHLIWFSKEADKSVLGDELKEVIEGNGFLVNESKVRLQNRYNRQEVTGIIVNEKLNIKRKYIRQVRAVLHAWEKYGIENTETEFWKQYKKHRFYQINPDSFRSVIKGRIEFIGAVRGKDDRIYLNFLKWLSKLAPDLVSETKLNVSSMERLSKSQNDLPKVNVWTEGKTDLKHLRSALRWLSNNGIAFNFTLDFREDPNAQGHGSIELLNVCKQFCKEKQTNLTVAIFDRDEPEVVKKAHDDSTGFKEWGNGVYSFALPIPEHRQDMKEVCIELYYKDDEIQRKNRHGRRLFLNSEFNTISCRHQDLDLFTTDISKAKDKRLKILDSNVFDCNHVNVALSKDDFANCVLEGVDVTVQWINEN